MFAFSESGDDSLQAELHSSLRPSKISSKQDSKIDSEVSDSDNDLTAAMGSSAYRKAARTYRAIAKASSGKKGDSSSDTSKAVGGSIFQSYTISRENSFSPEFEDFEYPVKADKSKDDPEVSDDSGTGRSTGLSLSSSAPKEELARELLRHATQNAHKSSHGTTDPSNAILSKSQIPNPNMSEELPTTLATNKLQRKRSRKNSENVEVIEVQTMGVLQPPSFHLSSSLLQSTPLGSVPGRNGLVQGAQSHGSLPTTPGHQAAATRTQSGMQTPSGGHPSLGVIPGRTFTGELRVPESAHRAGSDFDETEPLGQLTTTNLTGHPELGGVPGYDWREDMGETQSCQSNPLSYPMHSMDFDETEPIGSLTNTTSTLSGNQGPRSLTNPGLGSTAGGHPGLGTFSGSYPQLGSVTGSSGPSSLMNIQGGHPGLGSIPGHTSGGHPGLGSLSGGLPGLGSIPDRHEQISLVTSTNQHLRGNPDTLRLNLSTSWSSEDLSMDEFPNFSDSIEQEGTLGGLSNYKSLKGEPSKSSDSGVISGDYSEDSIIRKNSSKMGVDIDAMSDGGFSEMGTYPGIRLASDKEPTDPLSLELESALKHLNPAEVERRRKLMGRNYR